MTKHQFFYRMLTAVLIIMLALCVQSCHTKIPYSGPPDPVVIIQPSQPASGSQTGGSYTSEPVIAPSSVSVIHLVMVADTNDRKIGTSTVIDSMYMQELFRAVAGQSKGKLFLNKTVLEGYAISRQNMLRAIDELMVRANDIVVFSYSGHGHRYTSTASRWPLMDTYVEATDFLTVIEKIRSKNPRQFIVLADCCNNVIDTGYYLKAVEPSRGSFLYETIERMFLNSRVKIAASGSIPGQFSAGDSRDGGYFTYSFVSNLTKALSSSAGDWGPVFENTKRDVVQKTANQPPEYRQEPQYQFF